MIGTISSLLYFLVFLAAGAALACRLAPGLHREGILVLSGAFCLCLLEALPALFALLLGFRLSAALAALVIALLILIFCLRGQKFSLPESNGKTFWLCVLPLMLFTWLLLFTHTLFLRDGAYWCGQSTFGDLPMHLAFIESIARQGNFPPHYFLLAGQTLFGYPFLCETVSSVFLLMGAGLKLACLLPSYLAVFTILGGCWWLGWELFSSHSKASLGYWLFFVGSGFGFVYFMDSPEHFFSIFTDFYTTPTNYTAENIYWVNPIADLMIPQRATLFGWALLFPCLALLARFFLQEEGTLWPALFLTAAPLPLVHTHSALALVMVSAVLFLQVVLHKRSIQGIRHWLYWAAATCAVWLPQLFGIIFQQTENGNNFLRFHFNWINSKDSYLWFYIKNIGLVYLLLLPAFLWAKKKLRWFYSGGLLILLVSEFVLFQPNPYDNNKLLFIWHLLGCMLVANLLADLFRLIPKKSVAVCLAVLVMSFTLFGGVLTLGREAVSQYQHFSADAIAAAEYAKSQTNPGDLFLTGQQHVNPLASLAGSNIMCGSGSYVYYHGMNYQEQLAAVRQMYEAPSLELLDAWGVDYAVFSSWERNDFQSDEDWYRQNCKLVFEQGDYTIYQLP